jgi:hypothetical protein
MSRQLCENLEYGDLKRLIHPELHIDEYKSKMGGDEDICVLSFKVAGKEPAADLVDFIEKGYDWVLDADVSAGEKEDGDYLVFVEISRDPNLPERIVNLLTDTVNLTDQALEDWRVRYHKSRDNIELTIDALNSNIPLTPEKYRHKFNIEVEPKDSKDLDKLKSAAGVKVNTKAPVNDFTESLRIAAGIK